MPAGLLASPLATIVRRQSAFGPEHLYRTDDGGHTWRVLPVIPRGDSRRRCRNPPVQYL